MVFGKTEQADPQNIGPLILDLNFHLGNNPATIRRGLDKRTHIPENCAAVKNKKQKQQSKEQRL